ncbi:MAG: DUF4381 domain-containing protein [Granulosicoccus sp.]
MNDTTTLLEQLRDVRQPLPPEGVSWWLIVANIGAAVLIMALLWYRRHQLRAGWRKQLINDLRLAREQPPQQAIGSAATLLRQLMLYRGQRVQSLSGERWLQELDRQFQTLWFTREQGRVFGDSLYQPDVTDKHTANLVLEKLETLISSLPPSDRHTVDPS